MLAGVFVFAFTGNLVLAIIAWVIVSGLQEMGGPITETWLNQNIPIQHTFDCTLDEQPGWAFGEMGGNTSWARSEIVSVFAVRWGYPLCWLCRCWLCKSQRETIVQRQTRLMTG